MQVHEGSIQSAPKRTSWNKGKLIGAKPPLWPKHVWSIRTKLHIEGRILELALFNLLSIASCGDAMSLRSRSKTLLPMGMRSPVRRCVRKKTGRPVRFELTDHTREAVDAYLKLAGKKRHEFLFTSHRRPGEGMTTRQYARFVSDWIAGIGLDPHVFGTHSLRRTKATLIYRRTGNLRAVQLLLGHTKIESTVRYLGIEVDDALAIAEEVDV